MIFLTALLAACVSPQKPQIEYVEKVVETEVKSPPQYRELCELHYLDANPAKAEDVIILANKLKNSLIICNTIIQQRNEWEDKN